MSRAAPPKMIQVRNVRPRVHRELVRRAKKRGETLTQYVEKLLEREVATEPVEELLARIESRRWADTGASGAELVRQGRGERDSVLHERVPRVAYGRAKKAE
jgi:hypothetical protein